MPTIIFENALAELFIDLHASQLFSDGKEISDAVLITNAEDILAEYRKEKNNADFDLMAFFKTHFEKAPTRATNYKSDTSLPVETHINRLWQVLKREPISTDKQSTLISLPYPYIVPGGRFNEIYYWDSYFTMLGLQVSGEIDMIESMINNFEWLINEYGFIPNGSRSYFLGRSQPPFYALMVDLLAQSKGDKIYVRYLDSLLKEYAFWMNNNKELKKGSANKRVVCYGTNQVLNRYFDNINRPRTEMYWDDVELIEKGGAAAQQMILDIRAACESGWDFSSRWCKEWDKLETIHTTDILPVDLNCLLYFLESTIAKAFAIKGNSKEQAAHYKRLAADRKQSINDIFWNQDSEYYHDFDFVADELTDVISLAGIFPLFFGIASPQQAKQCAIKVEQYLLKNGGLLTTPLESGQQWDAPNGWAPLQWIAYQGFLNYEFTDLADTIKSRWTNLNIKVYQSTGKLMEKYNVVDTNLESGGGEYPVQDGFGWTNGVLLKMLHS